MKDIIISFFNYCKTLPTTGRFIVILLMVSVTSFIAVKYFVPSKKVEVDRPGQCDYLIKQNQQLVEALLDIKKNLKSVSYTGQQSYFMFASYTDTVPRKPTTKQVIRNILFKIDSLLLINKLDSLRKVDSLRKIKAQF